MAASLWELVQSHPVKLYFFRRSAESFCITNPNEPSTLLVQFVELECAAGLNKTKTKQNQKEWSLSVGGEKASDISPAGSRWSGSSAVPPCRIPDRERWAAGPSGPPQPASSCCSAGGEADTRRCWTRCGTVASHHSQSRKKDLNLGGKKYLLPCVSIHITSHFHFIHCQWNNWTHLLRLLL